MEGFLVGETFYCKELGTLKVGEEEASSFLFDIGIRWRDLTPKKQRQSMFVTKNIHKLPFGVPRARSQSFPINQFRPVSSIYIWSDNLVAESEAKNGGN